MSALDTSIHVTLFQRLERPTGKAKPMTARQLAQMIGAGPECSEKRGQPLYSCARFVADRRSSDSLRSVQAIVGDHDAGTMSPEVAAATLTRQGVGAVIATTYSHAKDSPRWRVICPVAKPADAAGHRRLVRVLNRMLGGALAAESETAAQAWYYGRQPGQSVQVLTVDGEALDGHAEEWSVPELPCSLAKGEGATATNRAAQPLPSRQPATDALAEIPWEPAPDTPEERARVRDALLCVDPDCGNRDYLTVCNAVIATGWDDAHELLDEWASGRMHGRSADKYDERAHHQRTRNLATDGGVTIASLYALAAQHGFNTSRTPPAAQRDTFGDISNGQRFAAKFRGQFLHVHAAKKWMRWDGMRWTWCESGEALAAAKAVALEALDAAHEALRADATDRAKSNYAHALAVHRNGRRLDALLTLAASEPGMSIAHPGMLDPEPLLLGVRNGVVNLRTGTLLDPSPAMRISRQAGAAFNAHAKCPMWLEFLAAVFEGDAGVIAFVRRALGYSLTGLVDEEKMFFLLGAGANGKSVFANVVHAIFGEYAVTVRAALLARDPKGSGNDAEREKARLPGARLALINEVGQHDAWDDQRLKEIVSRERISARLLYGEAFEFMPSHTIWMRGNHQPVATDVGDGFWRRIALLRFGRQFAEGERVPDLDRQILDAERDGVLAWMVEGCLAWQRGGLCIPANIKSASDAYRRDSDQLGEWLEACCRRDPQAETPSALLYGSYCEFLRAGGMRTPSKPVFGRQLAGREGLHVRRSNGRSLVRGVELLPLEGWAATDGDGL